jgi:hypothetical protein
MDKGALIGTGVGLVGSFISGLLGHALGQVAENTLAEKRGKPVAGKSSAPAAAGRHVKIWI